MKKITEITETRYRTVREKDALGNRVARKVAYTALRKVQVVSNSKRFGHYIIDIAIIQALNYAAKPLFSQFNESGHHVRFEISIGSYLGPVFTLILGLYYFLFEYFLQKTPGKFVTGCRVIDQFGNKPSLDKLMLRTVIRIIPFEAFSCLGERGWHDRWSDTYVVPDEEYETLRKLLDEAGQTIEA